MEIDEKLAFHILKLINKGFTFVELYEAKYEPELLNFIFKIRDYVIKSEVQK